MTETRGAFVSIAASIRCAPAILCRHLLDAERGPLVRLVAFVLVNACLVAAWWSWLARHRGLRGPDVAVYAGLLTAVQVVATQIALGAVGLLGLAWLLGLLAAVSLAVTAMALRPRRRVAAAPGAAPSAAELADPANVALVLLVAVLAAWLAVAAWLLPPRGVDDLAYHLPPLYQYVQDGRITLLPLDLRTQFAMPLGGDFLYLWPLVFFHHDQWVDGVGSVVAAWAAATLFALARAFAVGPRDAAFVALLFLLTPVVMAQAGSNYTDLVIAAAHLAMLHAAVRFWQDGRLLHLAMAGLAGGFGFGAKYNMLVAIAAAQPLVLAGLWRHRAGLRALPAYALHVAGLALLPAYWLLRNWLVIGKPLFPYALGLTGLRSLGTAPEEILQEDAADSMGRALGKLFTEPVRLVTYLFKDPGLGSLNGGLGFAFWCLGLPALAWCLARAIRSARAGDWLPLLFWSAVPFVAATFLQQTDVTRLPYNMRLVIVLVPLGLLALALLLPRLRADVPGAAPAVKAVCVLTAAVQLAGLAGNRFPTFDVRQALADYAAGTRTTAQRYYRDAHGDLPALAAAYEPLDWLTLDGPGWDVYMAADWRVFITAPLYGSRLQNRVWNLRPEPRGAPDALVYHAGAGGWRDLFYLGGTITPAEVRDDPRYELFARRQATELWVASARLAEPATRERHARWCRATYAEEMAELAPIAAALPPADLAVGSDPVTGVLRCLAATGAMRVPVYLVRPGEAGAESARRGARRVLSVAVPIPGAASTVVAEIPTALGRVGLHLSEVAQ